MVTPHEVDQDKVTVCDMPAWLVHKMPTAEEVLPMMSLGAAYALFRHEELGSKWAGQLADLPKGTSQRSGVTRSP